LFSLFYLLDLFLSVSCSFRGRIFVVSHAAIGSGIPVEVAALLPSSDWSHERVAKVVFSMGRALNI
jgi:hypothetical protein